MSCNGERARRRPARPEASAGVGGLLDFLLYHTVSPLALDIMYSLPQVIPMTPGFVVANRKVGKLLGSWQRLTLRNLAHADSASRTSAGVPSGRRSRDTC